MFDWLIQALANTSAAIVFFSIFLVGVLFSVLSLLFGGDDGADHDFDHDAGGDTGDAGDHDMGHGDGDGGVSLHGVHVSVLSVRGMALLATGFGGVGFLVQTQTQKILFSTAVATVVGYGFAFAVLYAMRVFKSQQANSLIQTGKAVGTNGRVTISVPRDGLGEIRVVIDGVEIAGMARSSGGEEIPSGTSVRVDEVTGGTFFVSPQ